MKKLLILLPVLILVLAAGVAFSRPEPAEKDPYTSGKRMWESFPRSGMRLGLVLSDNESGSKAGVRVERVIPDGPADRGGLKPGDVIISLDGKKVYNPADVREFLKGLDEEKEVQVDIQRDSQPMTVNITPEARTAMRMVFGNRMYLGINLQELDPDLASYFQVAPGTGVLVTSVEHNSPAEKAGIRSGDVITQINGEKVNGPADIVRKMKDLNEGDSLEITLLRHGTEKKLTAKPEPGGWPHMEVPDLPDMRHMLQDNPEFQQNMEDLRQQMDKLREEMQMRSEDMKKLKEEMQKEIHQQMDKLRQELKNRKDET